MTAFVGPADLLEVDARDDFLVHVGQQGVLHDRDPRSRHPGAGAEPARPYLAPDGLGDDAHRALADLQPEPRFLLLHRRRARHPDQPGRRHPDPYRRRRLRGARHPARLQGRHRAGGRVPAERPLHRRRQPPARLGDRAAGVRRRQAGGLRLQPRPPGRYRRRRGRHLQFGGDRDLPRRHPPAGAEADRRRAQGREGPRRPVAPADAQHAPARGARRRPARHDRLDAHRRRAAGAAGRGAGRRSRRRLLRGRARPCRPPLPHLHRPPGTGRLAGEEPVDNDCFQPIDGEDRRHDHGEGPAS